MRKVPFKAEHARRMNIQPAQTWMARALCGPGMATLEQPHAYTLLDGDNPLICAGVVELWEERAYVWSFLSADFTPAKFRRMHTFAREWIEWLPFDRLEAAVEDSFEAGHRWVETLGFERETPGAMRKFMGGRDFVLYAKVRG